MPEGTPLGFNPVSSDEDLYDFDTAFDAAAFPHAPPLRAPKRQPALVRGRRANVVKR